MRYHGTGTLIAAAVLAAGWVTTVAAAQTRPLAALAARQDLRDMTCIAMTDGHLSRTEQNEILSEAKKILTDEEFRGFQRGIERIAPPKSSKNHAKTAKTQSAARKYPSAVAHRNAPAQKKPAAEILATDRPTMFR